MEKLDQQWIDDFFCQLDSDLNVNRRESTTIEFKAIFDWSSKEFKAKIAKTAASFSNNKGGIILFGICNRPNKLVGITNFSETDDYEISTYFNEIFSPHIQFETKAFEVKRISIGLLIVAENENKPIICCKDSSVTFAGDIYFRYSAKSEKIRHGDLISLISNIRQHESLKWFNLLTKATTIGINNVAVLNTITGELTGKQNTFILDESLLNQIKILDRYSLQVDGAPAVKIIGNIPEIGRIITKTMTLYEEDILNGFITNTLIGEPVEYLKSICHSSTYSLPFYFIFKHLNLNKENAIELIKSLKIKYFVSTKLIERINSEKELIKRTCKFSFTDTPLGKKRKEYYNNLLDGQTIKFIEDQDVKAFLETLSKFTKDDLPMENIRPYLKIILKEFYPFKKNKTIDYLFRNTLTYIDFLEYGFHQD